MTVEAQAGKCRDATEKDGKLTNWEKKQGDANGLSFVLTRVCGRWGRGT